MYIFSQVKQVYILTLPLLPKEDILEWKGYMDKQ